MNKRCEQIILASINKEDCWKIKIVTNWHTLVGESLVNQVILQGISSDKMFITVKNSCLAQELMLQKKALLQKFNQYLGKKLLNDISFKVGSGITQKKISQKSSAAPVSIVKYKITTSPIINNKEEESLQKIKSSSLQTILKKLLVNSKKRI
jgi:hypothetical protein